MKVIHGEFEKLFPASDSLDGLLKSDIHKSIDRTINKSNKELSELSSEHSNCLDSIDFAPLRIDTTNNYNGISTINNNLNLCIYKLLDYYIGNGITDPEVLFKNISPYSLYKFLGKILSNPSSNLMDSTARKTLMSRMEDDEYNSEYYEELLSRMMDGISSDRERTVAAALFMTMIFPQMPYFFGGGHAVYTLTDEGIDEDWGTIQRQKYGQNAGNDIPYSLDCSSFMSWCFYNAHTGDYDNWVVADFTYRATQNRSEDVFDYGSDDAFDKIKPGDMTVNSDNSHIGMIVDVDYEKREVVVAHCSGSGNGMNLTRLRVLDDGTTVIVDDSCDRDYSDTDPEDYFTTVLHMTYDDE